MKVWRVLILLGAGIAAAAVEMPPVFSDFMVLQRDVPLRLAGRGDAGSRLPLNLPDSADRLLSIQIAIGRFGLNRWKPAGRGVLCRCREIHVLNFMMYWLGTSGSAAANRICTSA